MTAFSRNRDGVTRLCLRAGPFIVTIIGVFITACAAVGPDYVAPDVNPPVRWSGDPGAAATTDPLEPAALNEWWRSLDDPVLTELIERALAGNLGLRDAEARIRAARARRTYRHRVRVRPPRQRGRREGRGAARCRPRDRRRG